MIWKVPREWEGETAWIVGGGESGKGFDAARLKRHIETHGGRVIGINEAGLAGEPGAEDEKPHAPWCDVLYFADKRWLNWNRERLGTHRGKYRVTRFAPDGKLPCEVKVLPQSKAALSTNPSELAGFCSGGAAINLAFLFGATRIVLLFFDMKGGNWHARHRKSVEPKRYASHFMPAIAAMAWPLKQQGVEVVNAVTHPGASALKCFEVVLLEELLAPPGASPQQAAPSAQRVFDAGPTLLAGRPEQQESVITHLEMTPFLQLERALARLAPLPGATLRIRTAGADVVTRRSAEWWRRQLERVFPQVILEARDGREALFRCRKA